MALDRKYRNIINITLLLFLFLGLFILISLLSYAKDDPSLIRRLKIFVASLELI